MSHDHGWRAACLVTGWILEFHFEIHEIARGVTAMVVGSGALFGALESDFRSRKIANLSGAQRRSSGFGCSGIDLRIFRGNRKLCDANHCFANALYLARIAVDDDVLGGDCSVANDCDRRTFGDHL